jgi:hypothetical protein
MNSVTILVTSRMAGFDTSSHELCHPTDDATHTTFINALPGLLDARPGLLDALPGLLDAQFCLTSMTVHHLLHPSQ